MGARILGQTKRGLSWAAVAGGAAVLLAVVLAGTAAAQGIPPGDGIGVQDPNTGRWTVRDTAGNLVPFLYGNPNDVPFMGDWDCDGVDTPGLFRPTDRPEGRAGKFYLRNTNTTGIADIEFFYGNPDDVPLVGDWDGNGCDSVGVWRPATGEFLLTNRMGRNNTGIGAAQIAFTLRPGDQPFSGDWNGDGVTGVGIRNDATGKVSLKNAPSAGPPDIQFFYGNPGDEPISGDWDGNPTETIGVYRPSEGRFYLKNSNTSSTANIVVTLGDPFWNGFAWSPTPDDTPPGAVDQTVTTDEDTPVSFTLDATDEDDDDELTYAVTSGPSRGTLSGTPPDLTYTPAPDFNGNDFFTYEVMDDVDDDDTASATVQIVVRPVNDAPVAVDDSYATNNLAPLAVNGVLDNDTDVDTGDTLAVGAVQGSAANVGNPTSTDEGGTVTVDPDGSFTYDPTTSASLQALAAGETQDDTFTYRADDGNGGTDTATVTITVTGGGGLIQILKRTDPPGGKGFGFTDDIAAPNSFNLNDGVIENFIAVDPGTYTVTEDDPAPGLGFDLTGLVCTEDGIADSSGDVATRTATINVETGETVRCTFTNTERGTIVVRKQTLPAGVSDTFDFTGDVAGTIGSGGGIGVANVPPGTYSSTEVVPPGWELTDIDCDDSDSSGDIAAATATFQLQPGEVVTCTFTNTKNGSITIVKETKPAGSPQTFDFTGAVPATLGDGDSASASVAPGIYSVDETQPPNWSHTVIVCSDGNSGQNGPASAVLIVAPGEDVTCTFTNTEDAEVIITKQTVPAGGAGFGFTSDTVAPFTLDHGQSASAPAIGAPGTATFTEDDPTAAGYDLTDITCTDTDPGGTASTGDVPSRTATVNIDPGETVECTFTNTQRGTIVVEKQTVPNGDPQTFDFSGDAVGSIGDGQTISVEVPPGTYTSTETVPAGWELTDITCSDGDSSGDLGTATATFVVDPGETVTCTFENTKDSTVEVVKDFVGTAGLVDLLVDGNVEATDQGDGGTTGPVVVAVGTHSASEQAGTGTDFADYNTAFSCVEDTNPASPINGTGTTTGNIPVAEGDTWVCTFTNTRKTGTLEVRKEVVGNVGPVDLLIDGNVEFADAEHFETTGPMTVDTGSHTASEQAGTGTDPNTYNASFSCVEDTNGASPINGSGTATPAIPVEEGDEWVCTFTNTRKVGELEIVKDFVGTAGLVDLLVDGNVQVSDAGDGGTTFAMVLDTGDHVASEQAGTGTDLDDYNAAFSCIEDTNPASPINGPGTTTPGVPVEEGDDWVCTFTNTHKTGTVEVVKEFVGTAGTVDLLVDGNVEATNQGDGGTTGPVTVEIGDRTAGEQAAGMTDLADYNTAWSCTNGGAPVTGGGPTTSAFTVAEGDAWVCTFTNTRKTGTVEVVKDFVGTAGTVDLLVDGNVEATNQGDGGSTGAVPVDTGSRTAGEQAAGGTDLNDYNTAWSCTNGGAPITGSGTTTSAFTVAEGDAWVCTFTNTRKQGSIEVVKDLIPAVDPGTFDLLVDGNVEATGGDGTSTGAVALDTGSVDVEEQSAGGTNLGGYGITHSCTEDTNLASPIAGAGAGPVAVPVEEGDVWTCTFTNSANDPPSITSNGGGPTATITVDENQTAVTDVNATDDKDTEGGGGLTYSLTDDDGPGPNGSDNGEFTLDPNSGVLTFTSAPDFENPTDFDIGSDYEVQVTVTDSGPGPALTDHQNITVHVQDANDPPTLDLDPANGSGASPDFTGTFTEGGGAENLTDPAVDVGDQDGDNIVSATITLTNPQDGAAEELDHATGSCTGIALAGTGGHVVTLTGSTTPANYEACLANLTYENTSADPTAAPDRIVTIVVNDGTDDSPTRTTTITVVPVNNPPTVGADAYTTVGNTALRVDMNTGGAVGTPSTPFVEATPNQPLANNTDPDSALTAGAITTPPTKGTVSLNSDGTFLYDPVPGATGADSFTYTVLEDGIDEGATETVNLTIGAMVWYVDSGSGAGNDGTSDDPFQSLGDYNGSGLPGVGDTIFVHTGSGTYEGGIALADDQKLFGHGAGLALVDPNDATQTLTIAPAPDPVLTNGAAPGPVVTLDTVTGTDNEVRGLTIDGDEGASTATIGISGPGVVTHTDTTIDLLTIRDTSSHCISITPSSGTTITNTTVTNCGGSGINLNAFGTTLTDVTITGTTGDGVSIANASGVTDFDNVDIIQPGAVGIDLTDPSGVVDVDAASLIQQNGFLTLGAGLRVDGGDAAIVFAGDIHNSGGRSVDIQNTTGGSLLFTGDIDDDAVGFAASQGVFLDSNAATFSFSGNIDIETFGSPGFSATNGGTVEVVSGATFTEVGTTLATAVNIGIPIGPAGVRFDLVNADGGSQGIVVAGSGTGDFFAQAGTIENTTTAGIDVGAGTGTFEFVGSIDDSNGHPVRVNGRTGGNVNIGGAIDDDASGPNTSEGIELTANTGATIDFFGSIDVKTAGTDAGFRATGGGTVEVEPAAAVSIDTTAGTGRGIEISSVTIGAGGAGFDTVNVNGADFGILLANTGSTGAFTVNGGTIQNTTDRGLDVAGGGGNVTVGASLANGGGRTVEVTSRTGGTVTVSGAVDENAIGINLSNNAGATVTFSGGLDIDVTGGSHGFDADDTTVNVVDPDGQKAGAISNTVTSDTGSTVVLSNMNIGPQDMTFDSLQKTGTGGAAGVSITNADNAGQFFGGDVTVAGTGGATDGIFIGGGSTATFDFDSATIDLAGGDGIDLDGANGSVTFDTVNIDGSTEQNVEISGNTNPILIDAGSIGATLPSTGDGVNVDGGASTVTIDATIRQTGGANSVDVRNRTGGSVTFTGAIDDDGAGIELNSNNAAATFTFSGNLDLDTTTATAFNAFNSGTVNVTGASNDVDTSTGTGVSITGTTIGASGVTFGSVSVNGAANGIVLSGTGSSGGSFTVTGAASNCFNNVAACTGGAILSTTGDGISLTNVNNVSLNGIRIDTTGRHGIFGSGVGTTATNSFTLTDSRIEDAGNADEEDAIQFGDIDAPSNAISGTVTVDDVLFDNYREYGIEVTNTTQNVTLNVTDSRFQNATTSTANAGVTFFSTQAGSAGATVSILRTTMDGICCTGYTGRHQGSGTSSVTIQDSKFANISFAGAGQAIDLASSQTHTLTFDISSNDDPSGNGLGFDDLKGNNIILFAGDNSTAQGRVNNNTFGFTDDTTNGAAIVVRGDGGAGTPNSTFTLTAEIASNVIGTAAKPFNIGIDAISRDTSNSAGDVNLTVTSNTFETAGVGGEGLTFQADDSATLCLDATSNSGNTAGIFDEYGVLQVSGSATFRVEGMSGTSAANAKARIEAVNTGTAFASGTFGNAACPTPP